MSRWQFILQSAVLFVAAGTALGAGIALGNDRPAVMGALIGGGVSGGIAAIVLCLIGCACPAKELNEELIRPRRRPDCKPARLEEV